MAILLKAAMKILRYLLNLKSDLVCQNLFQIFIDD